MAISKVATYAAAVTTLKGLVDHDKTAEGAKPAAEAFSEAVGALSRLLSIALHRATKYAVAPGADLPALVAAVTAAKESAAAVNDLALVSVDSTDTALSTAKGSAVASGDVFRLTNVTGASEAVEYVGNAYSAGFGVDVVFA